MLRNKILQVFDAYIPEGTSNKAAIKELDRRGKITPKTLLEICLILVDELEEPKKK